MFYVVYVRFLLGGVVFRGVVSGLELFWLGFEWIFEVRFDSFFLGYCFLVRLRVEGY